ncbi:MAG: hypothetical protein ABI307_10150, partial [Mycobacterium sp.]
SPPPPQPTANDSAAALPNTAVTILRCDFIANPPPSRRLHLPVPRKCASKTSRMLKFRESPVLTPFAAAGFARTPRGLRLR